MRRCGIEKTTVYYGISMLYFYNSNKNPLRLQNQRGEWTSIRFIPDPLKTSLHLLETSSLETSSFSITQKAEQIARTKSATHY